MITSKTNADPELKTNQELLDLVNERLSLPSSQTGVSDAGVIETAIGALFLGQRFGVKYLRIIHTSKTIKIYEKFYGCKIDELLPQHGPDIDRAAVWKLITTTKEYWDLVGRKLSYSAGDKRSIDTVIDTQ